MRVDDLVRNEILWTHRTRELTASAAIRDQDQRVQYCSSMATTSMPNSTTAQRFDCNFLGSQ